MTYTENMSLDQIIELNKKNRPRRVFGTDGENVRGRDGLSGRVTRGGGAITHRRRSARTGGAGSNKRQSRSRSRSRMSRDRSWSRGLSRSQTRSKSRKISFSYRRTRSASRSRFNGSRLTEGKIELGNDTFDIPAPVRSNSCNRGIEHKPIAVLKQGISKRGRGISTRNRDSTEGLRSNEIRQEHRQTYLHQIIEKQQSFIQSRNSLNNTVPLITISVGNDFAKRRRNSIGTVSNLSKQTLKQHNNNFCGFNAGSGLGKVRFNESNKPSPSKSNRKFNQSRGRGRGRGKNFVNRQILNPKLQKEIAAIQSKSSNFSFDIIIDNISISTC